MRPKGFHAGIEKNLKKAIQRVEKNHGWEKNSSCPICKSKKYILWMKKFYIPIYICSNCTSGFSGLFPKKIEDVYDNNEQFDHHQKSYEKNRQYRIKRFGRERVNLIKRFKKRGNLLDVGCGNGWFLEAAKKSFNIYGVEENTSLCEFVEKKLQIKVYKKINKFKKNFFDVITLLDVIEHVKKPINFLVEISKYLKKNGIILIYTPNSDSLGFHFLRDRNNLIIPPYHLTYFNLKTFEYLPKIFDTIYKKTFGMDYFDIFAFQRDRYKYKAENSKSINNYQKILDKLCRSNHVRAVLKKK